MSTPTPETDAAVVSIWSPFSQTEKEYTPSDLARRLERERDEERARNRQWCAFCGKHTNHQSGSCYALEKGRADRLEQERDEARKERDELQHRESVLFAFINREMKMTADDPRVGRLSDELAGATK